eukprot:CAMPEP_0182948090 /NCGR_PEP_ID=MMETSP0105_2-20130417/59584_1 /TAXON_ID=81532 ORGANISM="Acanthoeca-like sp., Strain 10tr" /NCGR_SAMPLE_ID=MMETSP0105_2 /ASSEMBLY_ACC=CAM_ASM_000205 /LENGTH=309 /DNA_ID=CAMNT_0025088377 /DNA_START=45 /DNA_END=971 /DNA_ORIENTATION=-
MKVLVSTSTVVAMAFGFPAQYKADPKTPSGSYCGEYNGIVTDLNMTLVNANTFSISARVFGVKAVCPKEAYTFFASNDSIAVPGIFNGSDCMGRIAANAGLDPTDFTATYSPQDDSVTINVEGESIVFNKKQCQAFGKGKSASNDDCTYTTESACDANSTCTWCKCAAVPSACWTKKDAAGLPPGVYECDKLNREVEAEVEVEAEPVAEVVDVVRLAADDDCTYTTESACDANSTCTWCKCAAVPSACWTKKDAAGLPPGVYECDKLNREVEAEVEVEAEPVAEVVDVVRLAADDDCTYTTESACDANS